MEWSGQEDLNCYGPNDSRKLLILKHAPTAKYSRNGVPEYISGTRDRRMLPSSRRSVSTYPSDSERGTPDIPNGSLGWSYKPHRSNRSTTTR